jgi:ribonuclease HII
VAAAWLHPGAVAALPPGLDDSKKLSSRKRADFHHILTSGPHLHALVSVPVGVIDRDGILRATLDAMATAAATLATMIREAGHGAVAQLLIDGNQMPRDLTAPAQTVVKGDSRSLSIAAASVIAKHERDQVMTALAAAHPGYGWETNMGYGTAAHREAMARFGVTPHHRRSFAPVREQLASVGDTASTKG